MTTKHLPFAPLTHRELNERHTHAISNVGYYLRACRVGDGFDISAGDAEMLAARIDAADEYLAAARVRSEVSA